MADPDDLPAEITLEINQTLTPEQFLSAARHFFGYVTEVAESVPQGGEAVRWEVRVKEGSTLLGMAPVGSPPPQVLRAVQARLKDEVVSIEADGVADSRLPERAINHLKALSLLTNSKSEITTPMRLWVRSTPTAIGPKLAERIQEDWRTAYYDHGTLEGRLEAIQDSGVLQLRVRDPLLKTAVRCSLPDRLLTEALNNFRRRVEVAGLIHYRKNGVPVSIDVEHIEPLPDDGELPTANDVRGILRLGA